jgi:hypothetical protein
VGLFLNRETTFWIKDDDLARADCRAIKLEKNFSTFDKYEAKSGSWGFDRGPCSCFTAEGLAEAASFCIIREIEFLRRAKNFAKSKRTDLPWALDSGIE